MWHELIAAMDPSGVDVQQAVLPLLMAAGFGLNALGGILGSRSASASRRQAMELQQQQLEQARQFQAQAQSAYDERDPLRQMFMQRMQGFRGSPQNPFAAEMFGQGTTPQIAALGQRMGGMASGAIPMGGGGQAPPMQPGMPGAFNPYQQFTAQNNLLQSQIQPQFNRSALDSLRGTLGVPIG